MAEPQMGKFTTDRFNMDKFNSYSDRTMQLANSAADNLKQIKQLVPRNANKWLEAGAKLGALKGGAKVAGVFVRRNPAVVVASAAGAGLLWYAAHRKARREANGTIEGSSKRVEAKRAAGEPTRRRKPAARKRPAAVKTPTSD